MDNDQRASAFLSLFSQDTQNSLHNLLFHAPNPSQPQGEGASNAAAQLAPQQNVDTTAQHSAADLSSGSAGPDPAIYNSEAASSHDNSHPLDYHDSDTDVDIPPLIPIATQPTSHHTDMETDDDGDSMPDLQPISNVGEHSSAPLHDVHGQGDDDDIMPDLESVSGSSDYSDSSERDARDVEMNLGTHDGDHDSDWTDDDSDVSMDMPPLQPLPPPDRHVIVEEVQDPDDRPSGTAAGQGPSSSQPPHAQSSQTHPDPHRNHAHQQQHPPQGRTRRSFTFSSGQVPLPPLRAFFEPLFSNAMMQGMANGNGNAPRFQGANPPLLPMGSAPNSHANPPHAIPSVHVHIPTTIVPYVTITFQVPTFQMPTGNNNTANPSGTPGNQPAEAGAQQQHGPPPPPPPRFDFSFFAATGPGAATGAAAAAMGTGTGAATPGGGGFPGDFMTFNELIALLGLDQGLFGLREDEREDPERARRLVAGLEEVPIGLVKRIERLNAEDGQGQGCAICWDNLLVEQEQAGSWNVAGNHDGAEAPGFSAQDEPSLDESALPPSAEQQPQQPLSSSSSSSSSSQVSEGDNNASDPAPALPLIVSLPCSHVFHSACLIPWFSRPRQTTCPTCRFNVDPENLTYTPPPLRQPRRPTAGATAGAATPAGGAATANSANVNDSIPATASVPNAPTSVPSSDSTTATATLPETPLVPVSASAPIPATQQAQGQQSEPFPQPQIVPEATAVWPQMVVIDAEPPLATAMPSQGPFGPWTLPPSEPMLALRQAQILAEREARVGAPSQPSPQIQPQTPSNVPPVSPPQQQAQPGIQPQPQQQAPTGAAPTPQAGATPLPPPPPFTSLNDFIPFQTMGMGSEGPWLQWSGTIPLGAFPIFPTPRPHGNANTNTTPGQPGPNGHPFHAPPSKRTWALPPAPGPTLRQRLEQRERDAGWRCDDVSCGVGPSDEELFPVIAATESGRKRVSLRPYVPAGTVEGGRVCAHQFHPACLVSAERVSGWGQDEDEEARQRSERREGVASGEHLVEVACPVCRAVGAVTSTEWEEGVRALL